MTGNVQRERVAHELTKQELQKTIEVLAKLKPEHRTLKQVADLVQIIKQMKFFQS